MAEHFSVSATRVRTWDGPTRVVHWLMVVLIVLSWWTAENGNLEVHRYSGYSLLALLIFRLYWGVAGSSSARFMQFIRGPRTILSYLRGELTQAPGHNPLGALSVLALLALLVTQVTLGLFAVDVDGLESGPLSHFVSFEAGRLCAEWHETVFDVLVWVIALHIVAVLFYVVFRKQNLIAAMVHGYRVYSTPLTSNVRFASFTRVVVGVFLATAFTWWVARGLQ